MSNLWLFLLPGIFFTIIFVILQLHVVQRLLNDRKLFLGALVALVVVQLGTIVLIKQQVGDVMLFSGAGYYFRYGVDFYWIDKDHGQYPFFPFLIFFHAVANALTYALPYFTFVMYLKILLVIALHAIGLLIYHHHRQLPLVERRYLYLEFMTNPITYAVILFHGQIDVLLLAFLIGSLVVIHKHTTLGSTLLAGILYAASVATKTWSIIFLPLLEKYFGLKRTVIVVVTTLVFLFIDVFAYTRMVFGSGFRVVLPAVLKPGGPVGIWGISYLLKPWAAYLADYNLYIFAGLLGIGLLFLRARQLSLWRACVLLIAWVYLVIPNWGVQYLFWILPFLYLDKTPKRLWYLGLGGVYAWLNYASIALDRSIIPPGLIHGFGFLLWIAILLELISLLQSSFKSPHTESE